MLMLLDNYSTSSLKEELTYSEFKQEVKGKKVKSIVYKGDQMTVEVEGSMEQNTQRKNQLT